MLWAKDQCLSAKTFNTLNFNLSIDSTIKEPPLSHHHNPPSCLLRPTPPIEGSFHELAEEFAQGAMTPPCKEITLQSEIAPASSRSVSRNSPRASSTSSSAIRGPQEDCGCCRSDGAPEKEIIPSYNLLVHLVHLSSDPDMFLSRICAYSLLSPSPPPSIGPTLAISILTTIFNTLSGNDSSRYRVLLAIACDSPVWIRIRLRGLEAPVGQPAPHMARFVNWTWRGLEKPHLVIADAVPRPRLRSGCSRPRLSSASSHRFRLHPSDFLGRCPGSPSSDSPLFDLLEIFTFQIPLDAYEEFIAATRSLPSPVVFLPSPPMPCGDSGCACSPLTFACLLHSPPVTPHATIASVSVFSASEVEMWVIDTIRAGLVEGKLSQLRQEFLVHRATYRVPGERSSGLRFRVV
ncbi:Eukaryotic translation initiation factor [Penicillium verhagenii]|nr:Eukaryotic translation initiation factor [Penicillium verhagenii]